MPSGQSLTIPAGACVTPLAREEAFSRGVHLKVAGADHALRACAVKRVVVGSDHGGVDLKRSLLEALRKKGLETIDVGARDATPCDYPRYAAAVAEAVAEGRADVGVMVDGAGIGSAMAANKIPGVLAANCWDEQSARNAREHNHANVLTLGAGHLTEDAAQAVLDSFLGTAFGPERHARRVEMIHALPRVEQGDGTRCRT